MEAMGEAASWWFARVAALRKQPGDDLVSALIAAEVEGEDGQPARLNDREVVGFCSLLGGAGTETVTKLLANACVLLARHTDERSRLIADPGRIPLAVEEVLRFWAPSQYQGRTATRDVHLHGATIPAEERVILITGAANRDEREYADADSFIVDRESHVALGFGHGVHFCLGAALARMESRVGLEEFVARFPDYSVDEAKAKRVHMSNVHGFESVPFAA
jgi:cytochrome P450